MSSEVTVTKSVAYQVSPNHLYSEVSEDAVILDINTGVYYGLNSVGVDIWQWLQQPQTEAEILSLVLEEYDVSPEEAHKDIQSMLKEMLETGLVKTVE